MAGHPSQVFLVSIKLYINYFINEKTMQIASLLSPDENVVYVVNKFRDQLPMSVESYAGAKAFEKAMDGFSNKKAPDAFGFMEYLTSKDVQTNAIQ